MVERHEGWLAVCLMFVCVCLNMKHHQRVFVCLHRSWSQWYPVLRVEVFIVLFSPQMKMIIALVVVALLLIIISEYLTEHTHPV